MIACDDRMQKSYHDKERTMSKAIVGEGGMAGYIFTLHYFVIFSFYGFALFFLFSVSTLLFSAIVCAGSSLFLMNPWRELLSSFNLKGNATSATIFILQFQFPHVFPSLFS